MYSSGRTQGLVVDCGEGVVSVVPIWDAYGIVSLIVNKPVLT